MSETPSNDKPAKDFNKLDLSQLQSFSFGTQWSQDKSEAHEGSRESRREDRPRRDGPAGGAPRDRRGFRKPAGPAVEGEASGEASAPSAPREHRDDRPRREGGGDFRGPRREGQGGPRGDFRGGPGGGDRRREGGPRFGGPREGGHHAPREQGPYISPTLNVTFYPDDTGFAALAKAIRASCRTYELFEIARVIIGKNDRFIAVVQHKPVEEGAAAGAKPAPFAISIPDGLPFENEEAAINHVLEKHLGQFFDTAEVEIDPPKGNFQVVNKCTITGELLGPPNYHRYNQIVQAHHAANIKLPFEVYKSKIESVREPEAIAQWLEKMKKTTRYTWKVAAPKPAEATAVPAPTGEGESAPAEGAAPAAAPETPAAEAAPAPAFDSIEEARQYLLTTAKEKVVRKVESVRFAGKNLENLPQGEIRRTIEGALERQRRFPLDTANALRGRLRREGFTIFKKGSKGISYVCAVKRKFRVPGQTFSDSIGALITFIEAHPMTKASELPEKFLGFATPAAPAKPVEGAEAPAAPAAPALTPEQQAKLARLNGDLRWLVSEGYVTEFIDGRLFAPAPMVEARKKEIEGAEHDPENFPEVPAEAPKPAATEAAPAPAETATSEAPAAEEPKS